MALTGVMALALAGCSYIPAGNVGVLVNMYGSDKGVDAVNVLGPGRYWVGWNQQLYTYPTFMQNYVWTASKQEGSPTDESITFQSIEGMSVNADIGISYQIDPVKVPVLFQTYRNGIDEITNVFLRNMVRDAMVETASQLHIIDIYGQGKTDIINKVQQKVQAQVADMGIKIDKIYWIGEIRLPENVKASINESNMANQKALQHQNEIASAVAVAQSQVATAKGTADSLLLTAEAQAKANKILAESITPELVKYRALDKWDGVLPKITGGGATPFINMDDITNPSSAAPTK